MSWRPLSKRLGYAKRADAVPGCLAWVLFWSSTRFLALQPGLWKSLGAVVWGCVRFTPPAG